MEELTEVITSAEFHPVQCNLFMYSSSKGTIKLGDMRNAALCDTHAKGMYLQILYLFLLKLFIFWKQLLMKYSFLQQFLKRKKTQQASRSSLRLFLLFLIANFLVMDATFWLVTTWPWRFGIWIWNTSPSRPSTSTSTCAPSCAISMKTIASLISLSATLTTTEGKISTQHFMWTKKKSDFFYLHIFHLQGHFY